MLTEINATIRQRIEHKRQASIYDEACSMLSKAVTIADYKQVVKKLRSIPHFDGVAGKLSECEEKQEAIRNQRYTSAVGLMKNAEENSDQWAKVKVALSNSELDGYRDVEQLRKEAEVCFEKSEIKRLADEMIQRAAERNAAAKKKRNRILGTLISIVIIVIAVYALVEIILPEMKYKNSERLRSIGAYEEAIAAFKELGAYKDSADQIIETYYQQAKERVTKKDYTGAYAIFATIKGYKDVDNLLKNDKNLAAAAV